LGPLLGLRLLLLSALLLLLLRLLLGALLLRLLSACWLLLLLRLLLGVLLLLLGRLLGTLGLLLRLLLDALLWLLLRLLSTLRLRLLSLCGPLLLRLLRPRGLRLLGLTFLLLGRASLGLPLLVLRLPAALFLLVALPVVLCIHRSRRTNEQGPEKQSRGRSGYSREIHVIAPIVLPVGTSTAKPFSSAGCSLVHGRSPSDDSRTDGTWSRDHGWPPPEALSEASQMNQSSAVIRCRSVSLLLATGVLLSKTRLKER